MPEPISALAVTGLGWVVASAAGGIAEGVSDRAFSDVVRATRDRVAGLRDTPEGQDVARAVRIAQLQALERVLRNYQSQRAFKALYGRGDAFVDRSLEFCSRAAGRSRDLSIALNVEVTSALSSAIDGLLATPVPDGPADQRARSVAAFAEDAVLGELREALEGIGVPNRFEEHFRNGSRSTPRFLDLFAAYVNEQIKANEPFRAVFNTGQLARIEALAFDTRGLVARIEERFGGVLAQLDVKVEKIGAGVDQIGTDVAQILALVSAEKGVPAAPLRAILERLGEENVALDQIPERLASKADEYLVLQEQWSKLGGLYPDLAEVQQQALARIDAGDLAGARDLLSQARQQVRASRQDRSKEEAALLAREAEIDRLEIRYVHAAEKYHEAAGLVSFDQENQFGYLLEEASTLSAQGMEFGSNEALQRAIGVYCDAATIKPRTEDPLAWAMVQNNLGNALASLGERESGTERLEAAVAAYRAALEERTRERVPLDWATTQNNLGNALKSLGNRESGTERLEAAVVAYRAALEEYTQERVPLGWATTQNNLGAALASLGERESGTERLEESVRAYRVALEVFETSGASRYV